MSEDSPFAQARHLKFRPLQSYQQFVRDPDNQNQVPGVYVWGFCFEDGKGGALPFMPYYVGKDETSVRKRLTEHHHGIREETHLIFTERYLRTFSGEPLLLAEEEKKAKADFKIDPYKSENCCYINWGQWRDERKCMLPEEDRQRLQPHIDFYTNNLHVTFVQFEEFDKNKHGHRDTWQKLLERLEWVVKHELIGAEFVLGARMSNREEVKTSCFSFSASLTELGHIFKGPRGNTVRDDYNSKAL